MVFRILIILFAFLSRGVVPRGVFWLRIVLFPFEIIYIVRRLFDKGYYERSIVSAFEASGTVFIKIGQSLSLKPYLVSERAVSALSRLQDEVKSVKLNLSSILSPQCNDALEFEGNEAVNNGSIAQVYRAKYKRTGEVVAVKVCKPNIRKSIATDVRCLRFVAKVLNKFKRFRRFKLLTLVDNIELQLNREQNFLNELQNLKKIKINLICDDNVFIPDVIDELCSENVLVTKWVDGVSIAKVGDRCMSDKRIIIKNLVNTYMNQVYRDGVFHADLHPGNIFVTDELGIALVDFGIVGSLLGKDKLTVIRILNGFANMDYHSVVRIHLEAGYISGKVNLFAFEKDIQELGSILSQKKNNGDADTFLMSRFLSALFSIMNKHDIEIQETMTSLYKTILFIEAVVNKVDNTANSWDFVSNWLSGNVHKIIGIRAMVCEFFGNSLDKALDFASKCITRAEGD